MAATLPLPDPISLPHGLYETLVTEALAARLDAIPEDRHPRTDALRSAEAADRIAWHIARVVERAIEALPEGQRLRALGFCVG